MCAAPSRAGSGGSGRERYVRVFEACDEDKKGYLSREDFKVAVVMLFGYKPSKICTAWVKTLAGANIPLSKTDHPLVREFLDRRVRNGGVISARTQLTDTFLPEVYLKEKENLKLKRKDKKIAVSFVECCDEARSVLNVLFAPLQPDFSRQVNSFFGGYSVFRCC
ncbi:EF-hand calcium-binding domain-containing protein 11 isoform X2 [Lepidochelys kempii]|uniref:EF-hand calcium-binding domain-containing protein 11 isoform X2 n=1 Tax=Lepidochelys kempii TaxID=8472 RepID=UPI003C6F45B1